MVVGGARGRFAFESDLPELPVPAIFAHSMLDTTVWRDECAFQTVSKTMRGVSSSGKAGEDI
jgi:hypothetical protein